MKKNKLKLKQLEPISKLIKNGLAHAFYSRYWDMANTTYREEIAMGIIEQEKLNIITAKTFLKKCGIYKKSYPVLYYVLDGHIKESMGAHYNLTSKGDKFLEEFIISRGKKNWR